MIDKGLLLDTLKLKNISVKAISDAMGIDSSTFYRKMNGDSDFTRRELEIFRENVGVSTKVLMNIFFA